MQTPNRLNNVVDSYNDYIDNLCGFGKYDPKDKTRNIKHTVLYMLNRTQSMFRYDNLPESIPHTTFEKLLQCGGYNGTIDYKDTLYCVDGGLGGLLDVNRLPTEYIVTEPYIKLNKTYKVDVDCVITYNDSYHLGLLPLFEKYATLMTESELSMFIASINIRVIDLITARDDSTVESAKEFLNEVIEGKIGIIKEYGFMDDNDLKTLSYNKSGNNNNITSLIELEQYYRGTMYNEIGLNSNFNMKRETINSGESQLNNDLLLPLVDNMLECREIGVDKINKMFRTNIKVSLNSSWEDNKKEVEQSLKEGGGENDKTTIGDTTGNAGDIRDTSDNGDTVGK